MSKKGTQSARVVPHYFVLTDMKRASNKGNGEMMKRDVVKLKRGPNFHPKRKKK
jgi:hypothetical protein